MPHLSTHNLKLCALLLIVFLLSGCSWRTRIVVSNQSQQSISLLIAGKTAKDYDYKLPCQIGKGYPLETTSVKDLAKTSLADWKRVPLQDYKFNEENCTAELTILPGEALTIDRDQYTEEGILRAPLKTPIIT